MRGQVARIHVVVQGDTIPGIAFRHGLAPDTVWDDPRNAGLRARGRTPDVLFPGDEVIVEALRPKEVVVAVDRRHRFLRRGVPARTRIQLLEGGLPLANLEYTLRVEGVARRGVTDSEGVLEEFIPPLARDGELRLEPEGPVYRLSFGRLDPIRELSGVQGRLSNLGFFGGEQDGRSSEALRAAVAAFQRRMGLPATGEPDEATRERLVAVHDRRCTLPAVDPVAGGEG